MNQCCPVCGTNHSQGNCLAINNPAAEKASPDCRDCHENEPDDPDHDHDHVCGCGHDHDHGHDNACGCGHDHQDDFDSADLTDLPTTVKGRAVYRIDNMDCPMEEALIRNKLAGMAGVTGLEFNLMKRVLTVRHDLDSLAEVEAALNSIDMKPVALVAGQKVQEAAPKAPWKRLMAAGVLALGAELAHLGREYGLGPEAAAWLAPLLALAAILIAGLSTYKKGWIAVRNFNLNMNALMSFAVTGAMIIGQWPEAAMVMVLFNVAEAIETKSLARAREAIDGLLKLAPEQATVRQADGSWRSIPATEAAVGALVRVRPGERIALDGRLVSGSSAVNQASITGESLPAEKGPGDQVFAGTLNESGSFEYEVTNVFQNSTLARIIRAVEEAQGSRAPIQRFVDKFAKVYTPIVFAVAILVGVIPPLALGGDWLEWTYKSLVLLVIACPCALVISTPVTIVSGLAAATRHGLLVKGGAFLEEGRKLQWLMLDKTGTITTGRPRQTDMLIWTAEPGEAESLRLTAASLAARSDHPVSRAIAEAAKGDGLSPDLEFDDFKALPGQGISGRRQGVTWRLGNHRLIHDSGYCSPELEEKIAALEARGRSVVGLMSEQGVGLIFAVADTVRPGSTEAVAELRRMGLTTMMLTGDNQKTAEAVAAEAGIDQVRGDLMPEDKLAAITKLTGRGLKVGMVGDGINDAPALARADIGFAMGAAGTDTAIETADVALMDDDLGKLATFIRLSKSTHAVLVQNISLAIIIKLVFFVLTFVGQTTMWMAVFADMGVSMMVVLNGLRMLRK